MNLHYLLIVLLTFSVCCLITIKVNSSLLKIGRRKLFSMNICVFLTSFTIISIPVVMLSGCVFMRGKPDEDVLKKFDDSFRVIQANIKYLEIDSARVYNINQFLRKNKIKDSIGIYYYLDSCFTNDTLNLNRIRIDDSVLMGKYMDYQHSPGSDPFDK